MFNVKQQQISASSVPTYSAAA